MTTITRDEAPGAPLTDLDWKVGEHPEWWVSTSLIWVFAGPGSGFATSDLTQAEQRLWADTQQGLQEVRGELLTAPRVAGDHCRLLAGTVSVEAHHLHPYLKNQARALVTAEARLNAYRAATVGDLLRTVAGLLDRDVALAPRIFDPVDEQFYLGVEAKQLLDWAREFKAYEVEEFVREWQTSERERRQEAEAAAKAAPPVKKARNAAQERGIRKFVRYFGWDDYEPETPAEAEAFSLHQAISQAATAVDEEARTETRDEYLCSAVLGMP